MRIAIDDTYGPAGSTTSRYVTGNRRTFVGVSFADAEVENIRTVMRELLNHITTYLPKHASIPTEFHFVDIYNRKAPWDQLPKGANLAIFSVFADLYRAKQWEVTLQTIDDRTLRDHGINQVAGKFDEIDFSRREDLALAFLVSKLGMKYGHVADSVALIVDEGRRKSGAPFSPALLHRALPGARGIYARSSDEPLLQIADFLAFSINRSTHLGLKKIRTELDNDFISLVGSMEIVCEDLKMAMVNPAFTPDDFDDLHRKDRASKGLEG